MKNQLYYLATPIKHEDPRIVQARYEQNRQAMHTLTTAGLFVYSPMLHYLDVKRSHHWPDDWEFWRERSLFMVDRCNAVIILQLAGWERSQGVIAEIKHAAMSDKLIYGMITPKKIPNNQPLDAFTMGLSLGLHGQLTIPTKEQLALTAKESMNQKYGKFISAGVTRDPRHHAITPPM